MTTDTRTLNSLAPLASPLLPGFVANGAPQMLDLSPKKPSYGYDDEDEDGYDDEEEDYDDEEDEDEDEEDEDDDEEEDYDDEEDEDEDEDEEDEDDDEEDEDEDIGYYTRPSGLLCSV